MRSSTQWLMVFAAFLCGCLWVQRAVFAMDEPGPYWVREESEGDAWNAHEAFRNFEMGTTGVWLEEGGKRWGLVAASGCHYLEIRNGMTCLVMTAEGVALQVAVERRADRTWRMKELDGREAVDLEPGKFLGKVYVVITWPLKAA